MSRYQVLSRSTGRRETRRVDLPVVEWPDETVVYVVDRSNYRIQKFDSSGNFLLKWGGEGTGDSQFVSPYGVAVDAAGNVFVTDVGTCYIKKFDANGNFLSKWGGVNGSGDGEFRDLNDIAIDGAGNVYVTDNFYDYCLIQKFDSSGNFLLKWGEGGSGDSQFNGPPTIASDAAGNVYVADYGNHQLKKFDANGNFLSKWGDNAFSLVSMCGVNDVYVTHNDNDDYHCRALQFNAGGDLVKTLVLRGTEEEAEDDDDYINPVSIAVDASGNLYVVDDSKHCVRKFDQNGGHLLKWGGEGVGDGQFLYPWSVACFPRPF